MTLLEILKTLPINSVKDYGTIILSTDIYTACKLKGIDNRDLIRVKLIELEKNNKIKISYLDDDLLIGVKII